MAHERCSAPIALFGGLVFAQAEVFHGGARLTLVRAAALVAGVCVRSVVSKVTDTTTGETQLVPIASGCTRDDRCPPCADRARRLHMQRCRKGWHLTTQPEPVDHHGEEDGERSKTIDPEDPGDGGRRVRSTRRRPRSATGKTRQQGIDRRAARRKSSDLDRDDSAPLAPWLTGGCTTSTSR